MVVRAAQSFLVHRQYAFVAFGKVPHKADEPLLESGGIQHPQQPGEGIMAGDAVFQFEEGLEEFALGVAEEFHVGASLAAAEHSAEGDDQDVVQGMAAGVAGAGVFQGAEQVGELGHGGVSSASASTSLHARRRWLLSYRTPQNPYAIALTEG